MFCLANEQIEVNIAIMRAFVKLRQMLESHDELNRKFAVVIPKLATHDKYFTVVFDAQENSGREPSLMVGLLPRRTLSGVDRVESSSTSRSRVRGPFSTGVSRYMLGELCCKKNRRV